MTMQTDILSATANASGMLVGGKRLRLKAIYITGDITNGELILYDNITATGKIGFHAYTVGTNIPVPLYTLFPGEGILFDAGMYAVLTGIATITVFYG